MNELHTAIREALDAMFTPGQPVELRALGITKGPYVQRKTFGGYFDDHDELADAAAGLDPYGGNIYVTLNPPHPRLLARAYNVVVKSPKHSTSDAEVPRRTRLLIDCDPRRPAGIPSTDDEHEAALDRARAIRGYLADSFDWPTPLFGSSGNGAHLIYAIDLPGDDGGRVQRVLQALAALFDDDSVEVDTTCFNAARITKLFGTTARKGCPVPHLGMPHRRARILAAPTGWEIVSADALDTVAELIAEDEDA